MVIKLLDCKSPAYAGNVMHVENAGNTPQARQHPHSE